MGGKKGLKLLPGEPFLATSSLLLLVAFLGKKSLFVLASGNTSTLKK